MSELLKVERLDVHYGGIQAVRDISFTLMRVNKPR